ncbi:MAG TPA: hypothetical protein V6C86_24965 [Oculatellaceae cyanobacterium]
MPADLPEDLKRFLNQATMFHPSRIWAKASYTYDTKISYRKGMVIGGAYSPYFLQEREAQPRMGWSDVGGAILPRSRMILADSVPEYANIAEWITFLQGLAKEREGLLVMVDNFLQEELLATLLINNVRNVLQASIVKQPDFPGSTRVPTTKAAVLDRNQLPVASAVWVRKESSLAFVEKNEGPPIPVVECAVIEVGGKDIEDIRTRLQLVQKTISGMFPPTA